MRPTVAERNVSIGAIVLGYFTFAGTVVALNVVASIAFTSVDPLPVTFFIAAIGAVLGGYVAGVSARRNETRHGLILGAILAVTATASLFGGPSTMEWSIWFGFIIVSLSAGFGGFLRGRQQSRRAIREALQ